MFSGITERKMLSVRGMLLIGWMLLIASLFWDPFSAQLTDSANLSSPFRSSSTPILVQGELLGSPPYPMGARLFWTMLVPIVPLFLMVFGHEAWRRVCPLSLASQIPGYLKLRRFRNRLDRRTGLVSRTVRLIDRNGWLARNSWYVQFGFLFAGISARLIIINSDRHAMAFALLSVIGAAMVTGMLWGGKTWCNYICPANIVQKIYTEPGGILESSPHVTRSALPQSMCRKPTSKGDVSACVACTSNCADIDIQRAYWNGVLEAPRRNVYYMFFGLIIGFYGYYYLYAGNWDYYFSGIWTHESNLRDKIFAPGLYIFGKPIGIPKIIAAPMVLALACAASLLAGRILEALYVKWRSSRHGAHRQVLVHHCLSVAAWASINAFYLFGGRPNILLIPPLGGRIIDIVIVTLTTLWLRKALQQSPSRYQQEGMASGLLRELKKLKVDLTRFLENRKLEDLKPNEVYLLAKVLPGVSKEQKLSAYRNLLNEEIEQGTTGTASTRRALEDFRRQMDISEEEHTSLLEELGYDKTTSVDTSTLTAEEKAASIAQYTAILEHAVADGLNDGVNLHDILKNEAIAATLAVSRQSLQISDIEHEEAVANLLSGGVVTTNMEIALNSLLQHKAARLCLESAEIQDALGNSLLDLLLDYMDTREHSISIAALSALQNFEPGSELLEYAEDMASLAGQRLELLLRQPIPSKPTARWSEAFTPEILTILRGNGRQEHQHSASGSGRRRNHRAAVMGSLDIEKCLEEVLSVDDPVIRAVAIVAFDYIDVTVARKAADAILKDKSPIHHPMLVSAAEHMSGMAELRTPELQDIALRVTVSTGGVLGQTYKIGKSHVTIGRAADNDIPILHPAVWSYHVALTMEHGEVRLIRLDEGPVYVNGYKLAEESVALSPGSRIFLGSNSAGATQLSLEWDPEIETGDAMDIHPVLRLAMLARNKALSRLSHTRLADIAFECQVERYTRGQKLQPILSEESFVVIHQGSIRVFDPEHMSFVPDLEYGAGDLVAFESSISMQGLYPEVQSEFAVLLHLPPVPEVRAAAPKIRPTRGYVSRPPGRRQFYQPDGNP